MPPKRRVLFFIAEGVPTEEERAAAAKLGTKMFRNAQAAYGNGFIEKADAVAGCVPASYAHYPRADVPAEAGLVVGVIQTHGGDPESGGFKADGVIGEPAPASEPAKAEPQTKPRGRRKQ